MKRTFIIIFLGMLFLNVCCSKDDVSNEYVYALYSQTSCADPWGYSNNNEELAIKIKDYFEIQNIEIFDVEIDNKGTAQLCNACTCLSGMRIIVKVRIDDLNSVIEHGFQEH